MSDDTTLRALLALRDARDHAAPELTPAWRTVQGVLEGYARASRLGVLVDREDALSESLVKVMRGVSGVDPRDEAAARTWLRRIFDNTLVDLLRSRRRRGEVFDERPMQARDRELAERRHSEQERERAGALDPERLAACEDALWDRVDEHIEANVRRHARVNARRRAELAYERIVRERSFEQLEAMTGGRVQRATLYQWVHRGRDQALLPVAEAWAGAVQEGSDEGGFVRELVSILRESVRSDAGEPRAGRGERDEETPSPSEPP